MIEKIFKRTTVYIVIFAIISIASIVIFASTKASEINVASENASLQSNSLAGESASDGATSLENGNPEEMVQEAIEDILKADGETVRQAYSTNEVMQDSTDTVMFVENEISNYLEIPLPVSTEAKDILFENHYMDKELRIIINGAEEAFYRNNILSGNSAPIVSANFEEYEDKTILIFETDEVYEYKSIMSNGSLYISFVSPRELYDRIVVIDPMCGGMDSGNVQDELVEKDINLKVALKLKEKLDKEDIKIYYTRLDDVNPTRESRVGLANDVRADMFIQIRTDSKEDSSSYGISAGINGDYFIPGFGNEDLANILVNEMVESTKGKSLGIEKIEGDSYEIQNSIVPTAMIKIGCISNPQEAILFTKDDYIEKLSDGIFNAIMKAYEVIP